MFDWENLRYFHALAKEGSLSAAAHALGVDHATVGRRIAALELDLNARLLDRLPRKVSITVAGEGVFKLAEEMDALAFGIERGLRARDGALSGKVSVNAPPTMVIGLIAPMALAFRERYPGIELSLTGNSKTVSLSQRDADIAIRLARPTEDNIVPKRLGTMPFSLYASVEYVKRHSSDAWEFIAYDTAFDKYPHQQAILKLIAGRTIACRVSDIAGQFLAARAGVGIALLPDFLVTDADGLVSLSNAAAPFSPEIWLAVHRDLRSSPPIAAVMAFLTELVASKADLNHIPRLHNDVPTTMNPRP